MIVVIKMLIFCLQIDFAEGAFPFGSPSEPFSRRTNESKRQLTRQRDFHNLVTQMFSSFIADNRPIKHE